MWCARLDHPASSIQGASCTSELWATTLPYAAAGKALLFGGMLSQHCCVHDWLAHFHLHELMFIPHEPACTDRRMVMLSITHVRHSCLTFELSAAGCVA